MLYSHQQGHVKAHSFTCKVWKRFVRNLILISILTISCFFFSLTMQLARRKLSFQLQHCLLDGLWVIIFVKFSWIHVRLCMFVCGRTHVRMCVNIYQFCGYIFQMQGTINVFWLQIYAPTGPLTRDYDDVRRFQDAANRGIKRYLRLVCVFVLYRKGRWFDVTACKCLSCRNIVKQWYKYSGL